MTDDENAEQAARLFHSAWRLLDGLTELQRHLPEPEVPRRGASDWNDAKSYALCVARLQYTLGTVLNGVLQDLGLRNEFHIQRALQRPERTT
jgi:hypothetical protein